MKLVENALYRSKPIYESDLNGRFLITPELVTNTLEHFRSFGENEALAFWGATEQDGGIVFDTLITPKVSSHPLGVFVTDVDFGRSAKEAIRSNRAIRAQIHSHPGKCTIHSDGDDDLIVTIFEGMLSLVVPNYAHDVFTLDGTTFHQRQSGQWIVGSAQSVARQVTVQRGNL